MIGHRLATRLAVALAVLLTLGCSSAPPELAGYVRDPAPVVGEISLPSANRDGNFSFVADPDELLLVYFGFTSCPDICPTTLADTRIALNELGADAADAIDLAFVTVDPERDTDDITTAYAETFIDGAIALRTDDQVALQTAADAFGVTYRVFDDEDGEPVVEHSAYLFVVDDIGELVLTWPHGVTVDDMVGDLKTLAGRA